MKTQAQLIRMKAKLDRAAKRDVQELWTLTKAKDSEFDVEAFFEQASGIGACYADDIENLEAKGWDRAAAAARVVAARQKGAPA